jgi:hypothetical protein
VIVSAIITRLQQTASRLPATTAVIVNVTMAAVALSFTFSMLQYNLRTATRPIWYSLFAFLLLRLFVRPQTSERAKAGRLNAP